MSGLLDHLHPKLVHFPIALFIMALILELVSLVIKKDVWHQSALILYVSAALMTPVVAGTGLWEARRLGLEHPVLELHEHFALATMAVSLVSLPVLWLFYKKRQSWFRPVFVCLLMAVAVLVTFTGHYGGVMVYEYGVGTDVF